MTEKKLYNKKEDNLSDANYEINFNSGFCKKNDTSQMNRFKNKFAVVTGANGDFGKFCAEKLAEEGCSVILWDLESTETLKSSLKKDIPIKFLNHINEHKQKELDNEKNKPKKFDVKFGFVKSDFYLKQNKVILQNEIY